MTEISYRTPGGLPVVGFRDRSTTLLVLGIFFIIAGVLCGCITASTPMSLMAPSAPGQPRPRLANVAIGFVLYAMLCAAFISLGIGCIRKRRWVRPIILVFGCIALAGGVMAVIMWFVTLPYMAGAMRAAVPPGGAAPPPGFYNVMVAVMTVFLVVIYLIVPATLVWLVRPTDVEATLQHYDPQPRWTDAIPLAVLGLCALLAMGGLWMIASAIQGWFAAFGAIINGAPARAVSVLMAVLFATAAWLSFHRRPAGWWMAMALFIVLPLAWLLTLLQRDMMEIYRGMGMTDLEMQVMRSMQGSRFQAVAIAATIVLAAATLAFTWVARKHFRDQQLQDGLTPPPPQPR